MVIPKVLEIPTKLETPTEQEPPTELETPSEEEAHTCKIGNTFEAEKVPLESAMLSTFGLQFRFGCNLNKLHEG
jgi:hypothetical protein